MSSTFRDMQAERDYLVKFIFPQLRKLCESRGVTWGEVDLRWGVTDEQAAEGKVLPICLEEIKRCRPYFIGLLGERYGWVPQNIPKELLEKEEWLREQFKERKSVTELEILHGVLNNPKMAGHAYFYFRDPTYVNSISEKYRKDFTAENAKDGEKLRTLKDKIRRNGFPVRENYPDPKALGELVLADLTKVINDTWPEGSQPDPLDREAMDHEAYAQSRERVYIGRQEYFDRLDAHAAGREDHPLVVLGESGSGKSALLANWVARYRQAHPDALVLQHYVGATPYSADWAAMLRRLMGEFKRRLGLQQNIPDQPDALRSAFPNWLYMAATKGCVILVLDALNQLEDRDGAPDLVWLPPVMPENVRSIVSTLPGRPLDEIQKRHWPTLKVELLSADERRKLIAEYLAQHAKSLNATRMERIATAPPSANPLYLGVLLDELRLVRTHEELEERIGNYLKAESPYALYEKVIARWEQDYGGDSDLVGDTLSLLWAARGGLTETELLQALGKDGEVLPRAKWSPLFLAMSDALISRGGLLTFAHDFLRTAVKNAYLPTDQNQQRAHLRLADYFEKQFPSPRQTDELPWQLAEAHAWQRLHDLLAERVFFDAFWDKDKFEVQAYWAGIEAHSSLRMEQSYASAIRQPACDPDHAGRVWKLLYGASKLNAALHLCERLVIHYREHNDREKLQAALGDEALIRYERRDFDWAWQRLKEQERLCRELGNKDWLQSALNGQGAILYMRGEYESALMLYRKREQLCRELSNMDGVQASLGSQAGALLGCEEPDADMALPKEMALLKEQERLCRELGNKEALGASLSNQALILLGNGDLDGAMTLYKEEERLYRELGNSKLLSSCLSNQAFHLGNIPGREEESRRIEEESVAVKTRYGFKDYYDRLSDKSY
ncbi:MAG: DUF4062 domain-containing protein [Syntrophobacteraceae bacterium]